MGLGLGLWGETKIPEDDQVTCRQSSARWEDVAEAEGLLEGPGHPYGACVIPGHENGVEVDGAQLMWLGPAEDR